jgi:hypothetical protein
MVRPAGGWCDGNCRGKPRNAEKKITEHEQMVACLLIDIGTTRLARVRN